MLEAGSIPEYMSLWHRLRFQPRGFALKHWDAYRALECFVVSINSLAPLCRLRT